MLQVNLMPDIIFHTLLIIFRHRMTLKILISKELLLEMDGFLLWINTLDIHLLHIITNQSILLLNMLQMLVMVYVNYQSNIIYLLLINMFVIQLLKVFLDYQLVLDLTYMISEENVMYHHFVTISTKLMNFSIDLMFRRNWVYLEEHGSLVT